MKEYKFWYDPSRFEKDPAFKALFDENETLEEKIGRDIDLHVAGVISDIHLAQEKRGISDEELNENLAYLQNCIDAGVPDGIDYDLTISTLLKYAAAIGGDLKLSIEFPNGETAELL